MQEGLLAEVFVEEAEGDWGKDGEEDVVEGIGDRRKEGLPREAGVDEEVGAH